VVRSQHAKKRGAASAEVRRKVAAQARQRIDREAGERLEKVNVRLQQRILGPMNSLGLDPTIVSASTLDDQLVMRMRFAGFDQLGSHTPRPKGPVDALASFQLHETFLNNVIERLQLNGATFTLSELMENAARRLHRPELFNPDEADDDVTITFAPRDAVVVRCDGGQITLTLSIAQLSKGRRRFRDFSIRAFYRPEITGRAVSLVRDGVVRMEGRRLNLGSQLVLRGVFNKLFSKSRPWNITPEILETHAGMADLAVTQFVVVDGWIGVALTKPSTASQEALAQTDKPNAAMATASDQPRR